MASSLADLLAAVPSLNDPSQPFTYAVEDGRIVGRWDVVKATSLNPGGVAHLDKDYRLEVELDEAEHVYDYTDHTSETRGGLSGDGEGGFKLGGSKEFFSGTKTEKSFGVSFGGINKSDEGVSTDPVAWSFDTEQVKQPLFALLEQHGWTQKKGFFSRLFS